VRYTRRLLERTFLLRLIDDLDTTSHATLRARDARLVTERAMRRRATDRQVDELRRFRQRHLWFGSSDGAPTESGFGYVTLQGGNSRQLIGGRCA